MTVAGTHVWFSPFGLNTHATTQAMATMIRPMIRLALVGICQYNGLCTLTTVDGDVPGCHYDLVYIPPFFVQLSFCCTAANGYEPVFRSRSRSRRSKRCDRFQDQPKYSKPSPQSYPVYASQRERFLRPSADAADLANPGRYVGKVGSR